MSFTTKTTEMTTEMPNTDTAFIYEMSWYDTKRHTNPSTLMYYLNEVDTRWGHNWTEGCNGSQRCEIRVIQVNTNMGAYSSAINNSQIANTSEMPMNSEEMENEVVADDEYEDIIRAKWIMDGCETLSQAANSLIAYANHLTAMEKVGYQLVSKIEDDYGFVKKDKRKK